MAGMADIKDKIETDDGGRYLSFDLKDLLPLVSSEGPQWVWSILEIEAMGDISSVLGKTIVELEEEARNLPKGFIIRWDDLVALAQVLFQTYDATIVGCKDEDGIPELGREADIYTPCEMVIQACDSSFWRVYAREEAVLQRFKAAFRKVEEVQLPF